MRSLRDKLRVLARVTVVPGLAGAALLAVAVAWPMDTRLYERFHASGELHDRNGALLQAWLNVDEQWCLPRPTEALHPWLRQATIAVEDQRFEHHPGVDPVAVLRAAGQNLQRGAVASGASTITMQLVKMQSPLPRTLSGKVAQALQALRLDARLDKEVILTAYLNMAPYGGNLVGAEAAAQRYFGKHASELRLSEAALLAGLPKSPTAFDPLRHRARALQRRNHVLDRMLAEGMLSTAMHAHAQADPLGARHHHFLAEAPHLAARFAATAEGNTTTRTSLDRRIQRMTQEKIAEQVRNLGSGITNGAALVVDVKTAAVLAHVGSADFFLAPGGQVDLTRAARSPGSTLKPFTYARAMAQHQLYPKELLLDAPRDYGRYNPGNFDGRFYGPVTASDALAASRNIPALTVLERIGYDDLKGFLCTTGLSTLTRPAAHYGLGLTLGNCEVRLDELVAAYTMLANGGVYRPLAWVEASQAAERRILSPGVCAAIYRMLAQPMEAEQWRDDPALPGGSARVAWKTGTSTGFRDAWTVMYDARYVVGVWIGNSDGRADAGLVGATAALPVAARIFRALPDGARPVVPTGVDDLREVKVCAQTGLPPGTWCPAQRTDLFPTGTFAHRQCAVHYPDAGGITTNERWPAAPEGWDLAAVPDVAPQPMASIQKSQRSVAPKILNPVNRATFMLTHRPGGDRIALRAAGGHVGPLHWYIDGVHLASSEDNTPVFWNLVAGPHTVACMNNRGESDQTQIHVKSTTLSSTFRTASLRAQ